MNFIKLMLQLSLPILLSFSVRAQLTTGTIDFNTSTLYTQEQVTVDLSDGTSLVLLREYLVDHEPNSYTWVGNVQGEVGRALITVNKPNAVGSIQTGQRLWGIALTEFATEPVQEIDPSTIPNEAEPIEGPVFSDGFESNQRAITSAIKSTCDDTPSSIKVMVLYTDDAAQASPDIVADVRNAVAMANDDFRLSHISSTEPDSFDLQLKLVYSQEVQVEEDGNANIPIDLGNLTSTNDGFLDEIHALRDQYDADLVSIIVHGGTACGQANLSFQDATRAFSIVRNSCIRSNHSFSHELAHNFGARHDNDPLFYINLSASNFGFVHLDGTNSWRSVMANPDTCNDEGVWCPRPGFFSSPAYDYLGDPTGTGRRNNRQQLMEVADEIACYKDTPAVLIDYVEDQDGEISGAYGEGPIFSLGIGINSIAGNGNGPDTEGINLFDFDIFSIVVPFGHSLSSISLEAWGPAALADPSPFFWRIRRGTQQTGVSYEWSVQASPFNNSTLETIAADIAAIPLDWPTYTINNSGSEIPAGLPYRWVFVVD